MKEIKSEQEFKDIIASEEPVVVKFFTNMVPRLRAYGQLYRRCNGRVQ